MKQKKAMVSYVDQGNGIQLRKKKPQLNQCFALNLKAELYLGKVNQRTILALTENSTYPVYGRMVNILDDNRNKAADIM